MDQIRRVFDKAVEEKVRKIMELDNLVEIAYDFFLSEEMASLVKEERAKMKNL